MKKKMNNKGFSLVELIVVMAIMAILAVTLAPKLMQYVDKARKASDEQVVNTIFDTVRLSLVDEELYNAFIDGATAADSKPVSFDSNVYTLKLKQSSNTTFRGVYEESSGKWSPYSATAAGDSVANTKLYENKFIQELANVLGTFSLKDATDSSEILIRYNSSTKVISVLLDYDNTGIKSGKDYEVSQ